VPKSTPNLRDDDKALRKFGAKRRKIDQVDERGKHARSELQPSSPPPLPAETVVYGMKCLCLPDPATGNIENLLRFLWRFVSFITRANVAEIE
jgi:hypothetical protein